MPDDLIGTREAAAILGINDVTLTRWTRADKLTPAAKAPGIRGAYLFRRADIEELADLRRSQLDEVAS